MHPRTKELLQHLETNRAVLRESVDAVPHNLRGQCPASNSWSVAEVLEHLSIVEGRITQLFSGRVAAAKAEGLRTEAEITPVVPTLDAAGFLDRSRRATAPDAAKPHEQLDATTAWARLESIRHGLNKAVLAGDGLAIGELVHAHPVLGSLNMYQWIVFVGLHEARHSAQIREIAGILSGAP